jgi:predicted HicB family RNase H-like nuclease
LGKARLEVYLEDPNIKKDAKILAAKKEVSLSHIVEQALKEYLERNNGK